MWFWGGPMMFCSWRGCWARLFAGTGSRPGPRRRARVGLRLEALEDRMLPSSTPTIVVLGLGDTARVSNLTPPGMGHSYWTAPDLRSALVNAGQTGSMTDTIVVPAGT